MQKLRLAVQEVAMRTKISPEKALAFTKFSVMLAAVLPPDRHASGLKMKMFDLVWCCSIVSSMCLLIPLLNSIHAYKDDPVILAKSICLSCGALQAIIKAAVCRIHRKKLQFLLEEVNHFFRTAKPHERMLCQMYVNERAYFHVIVTSCCYGAAFFVICGPIFLPFPLPTEAKYPFAVNNSPIWEMVYIHQSTAGFQVSAGMCVDNFVAFFLWFSAIRFELLYHKFEKIQNTRDMHRCIKEHQYLLRYGKKLVEAFRYVLFASVLTATAGIAFAGVYVLSVSTFKCTIQPISDI